MVEDVSFTATLCFRVFYCLLLAHLSAASCEQDAVGVDGYILDSQLTASSELNARTPAKNGRLNFTAGPSWCALTGEANPYLQIDLQSLYIICAVSTQGNSQGSQWVEKYTLKLSTDNQTWTDYKENGKVKTFNGNFNENSPEKQNLFNGIIARYLRFVVVAKHGEACLRVEVFGVPRRKVHSNIALFKPTLQSSTLSPYISSNAVDGGKSTDISKCTRTNQESNPWWRVDLGRLEPVAEVNILNRNSNAGRLDGAEIKVGDETANGGARNHVCANITQIPAGESMTFFCKPKAYGRYVYIRIPGDSKVLTLCKVEVYSTFLPTNLALNEGAMQSSTVYEGAAERAVDGNRNTDYFAHSCTHTNEETDPWWRVDLGSSFPVVEVFIANRQCKDKKCAIRLRGFEIRIGNDDDRKGGLKNPSCGGTHSMNNGEKRTFYCLSSPVGRYVSIRIPGSKNLVTLCEVEVYSIRHGRDNVKGCTLDPVVSNSSIIPDQRFSASSSRSGSIPSYGRLKLVGNAWIPDLNNDSNDYLQIDLGSVYFVCGVATQGNPNSDDWTKTYKIKTSLDNVNWNPYRSENGSVKIFTGNDDRSSIVRNELYKPLAAKFIRFYPILFDNNKALRVEVYGSRQGCLTSLENENGFTPGFGISASSERGGHVASSSLLYGAASWCSSSVSPPQYLQVDFRQIITLAGVATQGDATSDKWVTSYSISYGYDGKTWISYGAGKIFTGNSDRDTVIVRFFAPPFAAQYVRIVPRTYKNEICMRMDLFGCKDFQVPSPLNINFDHVRLLANTGESVNVTCVASYTPRRSSTYEWYKDGAKQSETSASLTIQYSSAPDIYTNSCARKLPSSREVQCNSTYLCAATLSGIQDKHSTTANVLVTLKKPSQPVVQVPSGDIKARSTTVTWSYSLGVDEMPITAYNLEYQNKTSKQIISLGNVTSQELINLKPYTSYSVKVMASSLLGSGLWSNLTNFTTKTDHPEVTVPVAKLTSLTSQSIRVEWQKPSLDKLNGPLRGYSIRYRNGGNPVTVNASESSTDKTLLNLRKWTIYFIEIAVYNRDFLGPWSPEKQVRTNEDAPSQPQNLSLSFQEPRGSTRPQMTASWNEPAAQNGIIRRYKLVFSYSFGGNPSTTERITDDQTFSYSLDVLGGKEYTVELWAETIAPGPSVTETKRVPVYKPSASPDNITSEKMNETTYIIRWNPLTRQLSNGEVIAYEVKQTKLSTSRAERSVSTPSFLLENTTRTFLVLTGLISCSEYIVEVRAYTTAGPGVFGRIPHHIVTSVEVPPTKSPTEFQKKGSSSPVGGIAGAVVAVLLIVAVIAGVLFWRRRRRLHEQDSKSETHGMTAVNGAFDTLATEPETFEESHPVAEDSVERAEATGDPIYGNTLPNDIDDKPEPVPVSRFSEYVTSLKRDKNAGFKNQYKMLSPGQQFSWDVAKIPENKNKNRYGNIIAYDHSRVQLPLIDNIEHSGYINANYLHGYDETPKTYIACQGPVPTTFQDFWRMIWLENVSTIVMLTRLVEHGRTKCHQYWPNKSGTYHDITVTNHKTEKFADYAVRTFVVSKSGSQETRQVQQFHFLVWPDKGVPRHATAVLGLRRKVRARHNGCKYPLVVHCSAGVGRTGAFIVIDAMLESAENRKVVDVFNYVELLRTNRISMVQTEEQYGFIYMALLEAITCGNTEIPSCDLRIALKKLAAINPKTKMSGLASEYQRLELITADDIVEKEDDVGRKPVNASKNRFPDVIPLNDSRVVLMGDEKNDYINASFVDTYRERNSFIITQAPLSNTIQDFWRMVWDYSVGTIVMLNEQEENGQVYPMYWPSEGTVKFGEFVIEATSHEAFQDFSERELTVAKSKDPKVVRRVHHYHVRGWADKDIPSNSQCILDLITMVERSQRSSGNAPVIVHCSNGVGRSGTFCAILSILERLKSEQVIDVCQSVKVIRVNRPKAVDSKKQYVFCYNIVQKYLDSFSDYANFN